MALLDLAREVQRVVSTATDAELTLLIDAAIAELRRVGIREELLNPEDMDPLAKMAVMMHVKASYGHDDDESDRWWSRFQYWVTALMNSTANVCDDYGSTTDGVGGSDEETPTEPTEGGDEP
jgi:hypothetical protein